MQDLDFDELDKAVSSLMPQSPVANGATPMTTAPGASVTPVASTPVSAPIPSPTPTVAPVNAVERPATGRFMDVVHPSSDMRTTLNMPQRQSIPMTPVVTPTPAPAPVFTPPKPVIAPTPAPAPVPTAAPVSPSPIGNWAGLPTPPMANSAP